MVHMKIISIFLLVLLLGSCKSITGKPPVEPKFTVSLSSQQIPLGEINMQIDRSFPFTGIKKVIAVVTYFPEENAVGLNYKSDFFFFHQFWDSAGRQDFINALANYKEDYAARNLDGNPKTTKRNYAVFEGYLMWQRTRISRRYMSNMDMEIGYYFRDRMPYFAVTQKQAIHIDKITEKDNNASQETSMYFTRAKADELAALFDPETLREHAMPGLNRRDVFADYDEY